MFKVSKCLVQLDDLSNWTRLGRCFSLYLYMECLFHKDCFAEFVHIEIVYCYLALPPFPMSCGTHQKCRGQFPRRRGETPQKRRLHDRAAISCNTTHQFQLTGRPHHQEIWMERQSAWRSVASTSHHSGVDKFGFVQGSNMFVSTVLNPLFRATQGNFTMTA